MEVVASLSQDHTAAAHYGLFTHKSVPVIFEPPCNYLKCQIIYFYKLPQSVCLIVSQNVDNKCHDTNICHLCRVVSADSDYSVTLNPTSASRLAVFYDATSSS